MKKYIATVKSIEHLNGGIAVISFSSQMPSYQAGQYITIFIDNSSTPEGKAYSLASYPEEKYLSLAVKRVGEYSSFLYNLKPGDRFKHSQGYGHFNPGTTNPLVCFAGGVGISPIWSIIKQTIASNPTQPIDLAYSTKSALDASFLADITKITSHKQLTFYHHQTNSKTSKIQDRINSMKYIKPNAHYLICGSIEFVKSMRSPLVNSGINEKDISTEVFFEWETTKSPISLIQKLLE